MWTWTHTCRLHHVTMEERRRGASNSKERPRMAGSHQSGRGKDGPTPAPSQSTALPHLESGLPASGTWGQSVSVVFTAPHPWLVVTCLAALGN